MVKNETTIRDSLFFSKQLKKISEHSARYYISSNDIVMLDWAGGWQSYGYVAERQSKFRI